MRQPRWIRIGMMALFGLFFFVTGYGQNHLTIEAGFTGSRIRVAGEQTLVRRSNLYGFQGGVSFLKIFKSGFGTRFGIRFQQNGSLLRGYDSMNRYFNALARFDYVNIDAQIVYSLRLFDAQHFIRTNIYLDTGLGWYMGGAVFGKVFFREGSPVSPLPRFSSRSFYIGASRPFKEKSLNPFDFGIIGTLAFRVQVNPRGFVAFRFNYNFGLSDINRVDVVHIRNRFFALGVGYVFLLGGDS